MEKDDVQDIVLGEGSLQPQDEKIFLENFQISLEPSSTFGKLYNRFFPTHQKCTENTLKIHQIYTRQNLQYNFLD